MNGELVALDERPEIMPQSPQEMALALAQMKQKLGLVQSFFREVMVRDQDYGIIPGTDKPTLLKSGAEKLCELYGYAPKVAQVEEQSDMDTGFYRARVTVALVHRRTGIVVAEGVGEANTREGRYRWRWVPEWKLPKGIDTSNLQVEQRKDRNGNPYLVYRLENDDPWSLWNTVLKMAKKRALIDATLSATRSSGIFTQDMDDLQEWMDAGEIPREYEGHAEGTPPDAPTHAVSAERRQSRPPSRAKEQQREERKSNNQTGEITAQQLGAISTLAGKLGLDDAFLKKLVLDEFQKDDVSQLSFGEAGELIKLLQGMLSK